MPGVSLQGLQKLSPHWPYYTDQYTEGDGLPDTKGLESTSQIVRSSLSPLPFPSPISLPWLEQPSVWNVRAEHREERKRDCQEDVLTFRIQSLDLQLQGRVLQVEFAGRGDDLNAMDEVNDGITAQDLACG